MILLKKIFGTAFIFILSLLLFFVFTQKTNALTVSPPTIEVIAAPGQTASGEFVLYNEEPTAKIFYSSFEKFEASGETGAPNFTPSDEDLPTWIKTSAKVELKSGEKKKVNFEINVPADATPGGHFAAIFWSATPSDSEGVNAVSVGAKVGILVLLKVAGLTEEAAGIIEFSTLGAKNFYTARPVEFFYRFQNSGNDRVKPFGQISIKNITGIVKTVINANSAEGNVLPQSIRKFETSWPGSRLVAIDKEANFFKRYWQNVRNEWFNFGLGRYNAALELSYGEGQSKTDANYIFWIIPWHLLILVLILAFIIIFFGIKEVRAYNHWLINRALSQFKKRSGAHKKIKK
ncbi:hypothetical protein A2645_01275 [Candidatus Nomurabacteria bacterium RIFCSPHIGHO2_01_FULL_39_9]|uniref:DUF916 domain-containing protein n=1 Tax=Candidatus Nomurabacteria bacterium RIFCSPHIGHO2_01_FULL_39_9 TaxID=1801735 RepID=A0A1F6UWF9_9BACT|nr:MAG: hypothetical protein A2645_01275 [Candidatus Nomurabacteria bacterium RIFCSPHIGHO2_01_FULL_39_9]